MAFDWRTPERKIVDISPAMLKRIEDAGIKNPERMGGLALILQIGMARFPSANETDTKAKARLYNQVKAAERYFERHPETGGGKTVYAYERCDGTCERVTMVYRRMKGNPVYVELKILPENIAREEYELLKERGELFEACAY